MPMPAQALVRGPGRGLARARELAPAPALAVHAVRGGTAESLGPAACVRGYPEATAVAGRPAGHLAPLAPLMEP